MGSLTDKKYTDAVALAKSVKGVQTRLTQAKLKDIDAQYNTAIADAKRSKSEEKGYVKRRDSGLIDRKIWRNDDQLSLYNNDKANGSDGTYTCYYEQDKKNNPREEQFEHMAYFEFKDLETATAVFKALSASFNVMMSPCTEGHILGKPYKVVTI
jgi:hypothetical protein